MLKFRELYEIWRRDNFLEQALEESYVMLESTKEMFEKSVFSLRKTESSEIAMDVYQMDKQVNSYLQDVRRKVFKHMAVTGGANIIPGLVLTSIVIDVERIGDYTKNITDLAIAHPRKLHCGRHEERIQKIETSVAAVFQRITPCVRTSDKDTGLVLMKENAWITRECEEIVMGLVKEGDPKLSEQDAVSTALYARHLKRIAAHLLNIASSVVNPFDKVGFREEE